MFPQAVFSNICARFYTEATNSDYWMNHRDTLKNHRLLQQSLDKYRVLGRF